MYPLLASFAFGFGLMAVLALIIFVVILFYMTPKL